MNRMSREGWDAVSVPCWNGWKLCLLITFSRELPPEKGGGDRDEETASGPGDAALRHGGIHRLPLRDRLALAVRKARRDS